MWPGKAEQALWVVTDGAYAKAPFLKAMTDLGVTVAIRVPRCTVDPSAGGLLSAPSEGPPRRTPDWPGP